MKFTRQMIWQHNGFRGSARMMQMQCLAICQSKTATEEAKGLATHIYELAGQLAAELKTRKDQQGS